jgi:hypothetical protein
MVIQCRGARDHAQWSPPLIGQEDLAQRDFGLLDTGEPQWSPPSNSGSTSPRPPGP